MVVVVWGKSPTAHVLLLLCDSGACCVITRFVYICHVGRVILRREVCESQYMLAGWRRPLLRALC